jgi:hypothetical protein
LRVRQAREHLEAGAASGEVALRLGFSCHASLRRALARHLPEVVSEMDCEFGGLG